MSEYSVSYYQFDFMKHALGIDWLSKEEIKAYAKVGKFNARRNHCVEYEYPDWVHSLTIAEAYNLVEQGLMNCFRDERKTDFQSDDFKAYLDFLVTDVGMNYLGNLLGFKIRLQSDDLRRGKLITNNTMTDEMKQCSRFVAASR